MQELDCSECARIIRQLLRTNSDETFKCSECGSILYLAKLPPEEVTNDK